MGVASGMANGSGRVITFPERVRFELVFITEMAQALPNQNGHWSSCTTRVPLLVSPQHQVCPALYGPNTGTGLHHPSSRSNTGIGLCHPSSGSKLLLCAFVNRIYRPKEKICRHLGISEGSFKSFTKRF